MQTACGSQVTNKRAGIFLLLVLALWLAGIFPSLAEGGPQIGEIVEKSLTAYGGKDALMQLASGAVIYGKKTNAAGETVGYREVKKGNKWRIDVDPSPGSDAAAEIFAFDGSF